MRDVEVRRGDSYLTRGSYKTGRRVTWTRWDFVLRARHSKYKVMQQRPRLQHCFVSRRVER